MDLPEKAKRAPPAPVWNQSFPSSKALFVRGTFFIRCYPLVHSRRRSPIRNLGTRVAALVPQLASGTATDTTSLAALYVLLVLLWLQLPVSVVLNFISVLCVVQAGLRPICEFMTFNFSMQGIDQVLYLFTAVYVIICGIFLRVCLVFKCVVMMNSLSDCQAFDITLNTFANNKECHISRRPKMGMSRDTK